MNYQEWIKQVKHKMIDLDLTPTKLAANIDRSGEFVRSTLSGRLPREAAVKEISEYLGIENYLEGKK